MFSKSIKRMFQVVKVSRFKYAAAFSFLVLVLVFGAVQANGHGRPQPPRPPQGPMWGMPMPNWRPWVPAQPVPTITIIAVVKDSSVTFETANFPAEQDFTVTMGKMYTRGIGGIEVGMFNSGDGSPSQETFPIPEELYGQYRIAIRAQTAHQYPYYAYNWFYNNTATVESTTAAEADTAEADNAEAAPAAPEAGTGGVEEPESAETPTEVSLTGVVWQWTEFTDAVQGAVAVENPEQYNIQFLPEGLVGIKADCNNGSGTYIVDEESGIDIAIGAMTLALCPPESLSDQFVQYLNDVAIYSFDGADLLLDLMADGGTMRFTAVAEVEVPAEGEAETPVEEPEAAASVTGTVTYLPRIALPDDAVVTVQIMGISPADAPAAVVAEQVIETAGQQVPIAFEVTYDPNEISEDLSYEISARIEDGAGTLLFISDTAIPVITQDNPTEDVEIMTVPASADDGAGEAEVPEDGMLTGVVWQWSEFSDPVQGTLPIDSPEKYTVEFSDDGTVDILADCNNGSGSYVAEESRIDITVGAVTLALCEEDSLSDQFLQYLDAAVIYFFDEGDLLMDLPVDSGTLRFTASAEESASAAFVAAAESAVIPVMASVNGQENGQESTIPSFKICSVIKDETVTIVTENFPAGQEFAVKMGITMVQYPPMQKQPMPPQPMPYQGPMGPGMGPQMGMPGMAPKPMNPGGMWQNPQPQTYTAYYEAGTLQSGKGGVLEATFEIPEELAGSYRIAILLRTAHQYPYLAYNWFYNNTADVCNGVESNDA